LPTLYFTVTNDLNYDQRMIRICRSLAEHGYDVWLIGRERKGSLPLKTQAFRQKRLTCIFDKGKWFYIEYNLRLFFFLLFRKMDLVCAIDLDCILPVYFISRLKKVHRVYDAHELFCEMKEVVSRPGVYKAWKWIEKRTVPNYSLGYTVNEPIADAFRKMYRREYAVIRNIARYEPLDAGMKREKIILYQGAVNEGRCFETLIPAMQWVNAPLWICGDGNFMRQTKALIQQYKLEHKVICKGMMPPDELRDITRKAWIGLTLFEPGAESNYYSLANRFFDYMQAGLPQICVDYPVYREINKIHGFAVLTRELGEHELAQTMNDLLQDEKKWQVLHTHCLEAAHKLNWQEEEKKLIAFYRSIFG